MKITPLLPRLGKPLASNLVVVELEGSPLSYDLAEVDGALVITRYGGNELTVRLPDPATKGVFEIVTEVRLA